ncbi:OadG family protein [Agathobaculum sp.]|uniref:OadG family protein n=1 Tax=Agathobaculum sp. TaxID=2048138 RepID=UPI003A8F3E00
MVHDPISVLDALMIALSGIVIVFLMLALLWGVIAVISRVMGVLEKHTAHPASVSAAAPAAAAPAAAPAPAPAPVPQVKLEGVSEVEAACVMAIVSHETGIPLDQLVFKSIKAV